MVSTRSELAKHIAFIAVFQFLASVSRLLVTAEGGVSSVWLPFGFALAFLIHFGARFAVTMFLMELVAGIFPFSLPALPNTAIALGNTATVYLGYRFLVSCKSFDGVIRDEKAVFVFLIGSVAIANSVSAFVGNVAVVHIGWIDHDEFLRFFAVWWWADMIGAALITPIFLELFDKNRKQLIDSTALLTRFTLYAIALLVSVALPALMTEDSSGYTTVLVYLIFPIALWVASKYSVFSTCVLVAGVSFGLIALTVNGIGPFGSTDLTESLMRLHGFVLALACASLTVAVKTSETREAALSLGRINSELEEQKERLMLSEKQAVRSNEAKSLFLAMMTHEIRTPLNGILGFSQLLGRTKLNEEQKNYVSIINKSGDSLLDVVNETLEHSKIEAGEMTIHPHPTSIPKLLGESVSLYSANAENKQIKLHLETEPALEAAVEVDSARVRQVVNNLVSNAIKFTDSGTIKLSAAALRVDERINRIRIEVTDTGIGIEPNELKNLFDPYKQAQSHRKHMGSGLGLSICRRLCHLMGGDISVASEKGQGSTFTFEIEAVESQGQSAG